LPVEGVVVAAVAEVEKAAGGGEEVEGGFGIAVRGVESERRRPVVGGAGSRPLRWKRR
jgi:hypothetical protein